MKKIICAVLIAAILACSGIAFAGIPKPSNDLFTYITNAINLIALKEYNKMDAFVPFADAAPSADEWQSFAEGNFTTLIGSMPQNRYIVRYWNGSAWKVAMPVQEPHNDAVETLVLLSEDGETFIGYGCAPWGEIRAEYSASAHVTWTEEYMASTFALIEHDK